MRNLRHLVWCLAAAIALPSTAAIADDHHDDHHDRDKDKDKDRHRWPKEAPPAPQAETAQTAAGKVWIAGRWDWKDGKWAWLAGHLEAEQAGKKWQVGRWEQRGDHYELVDGVWVDAAQAAPPAPPPPPDDHHHRDWKLDAPTVSSYWPAKGKPGTKVVVRGKNFPTSASVEYGGRPIAAAKIDADRIAFDIPKDAPTATGDLVIRMDHHKLVVGSFEVVAGYDADAEAKRLADEQRKAAEAAWAARQKELAADRAARQAAVDKREAEYEKSREERRAKREAEIRAKFEAAFLADADTQAELTLHAQRVAEIERMKDVIEVQDDSKLGVRIGIVEKKENDRHDARMAALLAAFKAKGGAK